MHRVFVDMFSRVDIREHGWKIARSAKSAKSAKSTRDAVSVFEEERAAQTAEEMV